MEDIEEIRKKSGVLTHSEHLLVIGVLILLSLAVGMGYAHIEDVNDFGDAKPEDIAFLRVGFGIGYSLVTMLFLSVPYLIYSLNGTIKFIRTVRGQDKDKEDKQ